MSDLTGHHAAVAAIRAAGDRDGVHRPDGIFLVTHFDSSPEQNMGPMMAQEFGATFIGLHLPGARTSARCLTVPVW
jgi:hypothetical protein